MKQGLLKRLARIEALATPPPPERPAPNLCLDYEGRILGNGREEMKEWEGRHVSEWPAEWWDRPRPMVLLVSVDPKAPPDLSCLDKLRPGAVVVKRYVGLNLADV